MSVTVPVSVAVSMSVSVTVTMAEFVSVPISSVHDRFRFSVRVHVWAVSKCHKLCPRVDDTLSSKIKYAY